MKKIILMVSLILSICIVSLEAQEAMFKKGETVLNASIGLGSVLYSGLNLSSVVPPLGISLEYGIADKVIDKGSVGVGGYVGYSAYKENPAFPPVYKYSNFIIGARGVLHYPFVARLDTYTGLMLGANISTALGTKNPLGIPGGGPSFSWFAGARYYFNRDFAALAEIGYGIAWLNFGIAYKLN